VIRSTHPTRARPELMASAPNQCWSWDITKLRGPDKGVWFDLYVIIDIFSRYVVDWMVAPGESAKLAEAFLTAGQDVKPGTLTIHADRGTSMTSKPVAELLADLGIGRTHSRPHVSNDNPYSEAAFKTLKYCPAFPERFGSIADARVFCEQFFSYYNHEHGARSRPTVPPGSLLSAGSCSDVPQRPARSSSSPRRCRTATTGSSRSLERRATLSSDLSTERWPCRRRPAR
jgi:transposase InsO family protein